MQLIFHFVYQLLNPSMLFVRKIHSLLGHCLMYTSLIKETTIVHAVCSQSGRNLIVPINSFIQFSVMYNPVENNEVAETGFSSLTTNQLFNIHPLPQVVAVEKHLAGEKKASTFVTGEVLFLKGFDGRKCISIPSHELKFLRESMKISVTTNESKIQLYLSEVVQYLALPVQVKFFPTEKNSKATEVKCRTIPYCFIS